MKKHFSVICIFTLLISTLLFGCGKNNDGNSATDVTVETTEATKSPESTDNITQNTYGEQNETTTLTPEPVPVDSNKIALSDGETYTGLKPLALREFNVSDPENTKGLSTEKHGYGFGVSKNGQPHEISKNNQAYFEKNSFNAFCLDTKSTEKVLYLTFDCGYENGYTAKILDTLKEKQVPSAFFCTLPQVKDYPQLISRMINEGHIVGNHSVTHPSFPTITKTEMASEIKKMDDYLRTYFGYSEPFFRFPMGEYSDCALDLVSSLGYKCVFWSVAYSDWDLNKQKGADNTFNTVTARLHPGAVILLHSVSPDNAAALGRIIDWAKNEGYTFKSLRDYK